MDKKNRKRGFTMIEMLAVLVIIGLIVTVVTAATLNHVKKARKTTTMASMVKIKEAIQMYKMYETKYPDSLSDLIPEYIEKQAGLKDGWGNKYEYSPQGDDGPFDLISGGSDGDVSSPEDNINIWKIGEDTGTND